MMMRRTVLKGGFVLAATAHTSVASGDIAADPLMDAINAYYEGARLFNDLADGVGPYADEDAAIAATYGPTDDALRNWDSPASTRKSAIAALMVARAELRDYSNSDIAKSMIAASIGYLETETRT